MLPLLLLLLAVLLEVPPKELDKATADDDEEDEEDDLEEEAALLLPPLPSPLPLLFDEFDLFELRGSCSANTSSQKVLLTAFLSLRKRPWLAAASLAASPTNTLDPTTLKVSMGSVMPSEPSSRPAKDCSSPLALMM